MITGRINPMEEKIIEKTKEIKAQENLPLKKCVIKAIRELNCLGEIYKSCTLFNISLVEYVDSICEKVNL